MAVIGIGKWDRWRAIGWPEEMGNEWYRDW